MQLDKVYMQGLCECYGLPDYLAKKYNKFKIIILCEGIKNSFDYLIYSKVYSNAMVLPSNGNMDVINKTKGLRKNSNIFYGIIDGDCLNLNQKQVLQNDNIYCLGVYAIENLLAIDDVILMIMEYLNVKDCKQIIYEIKTKAFYLMQQNDKHIDLDNILLQMDPKRVIGTNSWWIEIQRDIFSFTRTKFNKINFIKLYS